MEEEDDVPPVAVPVGEPPEEIPTPEPFAGAPVGVTVITGYLGAGKSTVSSSMNSLFSSLSVITTQSISYIQFRYILAG